MATTLLIDGNAVVYTIPPFLCTDKRDFVNKFINKINDYSKKFHTMCKIILFFDDKAGGTWRENLYKDYQNNRKVKNYNEQQLDESNKRKEYLKYLKEQINKSKYSYLHYKQTESDDLISLYCNNIQEENETVIIVTTDKDLFQLISENPKKQVKVYFLVKKQIITSEKEGKKTLEEKIMLGDNSDNIPSVCCGVGAKYYNDFKQFLKTTKELNIEPTDINESKKCCESLGIKYVKSFSNFNKEQLRINRLLVDLKTVCKLDSENNFEKTQYIKDNLKTAKISPYSLYSLKII